MRILFAGSPDIAVPALEVLAELTLEGGHTLAGVLTNPDSRRGRSRACEASAVGARAERMARDFSAKGLPLTILKPEKLDGDARDAVRALDAELLVSFAYGRIFGPKFLSLFSAGGVNIHPSLLPRHRGPAPIQAVILGREKETGISIQKLAPEMDTGNILVQERFPLEGRETGASLSGIVAKKSAVLLVSFLTSLGDRLPPGLPQNSKEATYTSLVKKEDGRIDWSLPASELDARIRAYTPWPLCVTCHGEAELYILEGACAGAASGGEAGSRLTGGGLPGTVAGVDKDRGILIQTGKGMLCVSRLQYGTKKALPWQDFLNGAKGFLGSVLG